MAADLTTTVQIYEQDTGDTQVANSPFGYKELIVETPDTSDPTDYFTVTLSDYGITTMKSFRGWVHSSSAESARGSVLVVTTASTCTQGSTGTTYTAVITITGSTANKTRTYLIGGI
jgi:hypothetical protein